MIMLLINNIKNIKKDISKIIPIIILVLISCLIYTSINVMYNLINKSYEKTIKDYNISDISVNIKIDVKDDFENEKVRTYFSNKTLKNEELNIINEYLKCNNTSSCSNYIYYNINEIFKNYGLILNKEKEIIENLKTRYNLNIEKEVSKTIYNNDEIIKVFPYVSHIINKPYLIKGNEIINDDDILILQNYATYKKININDTYTLNNKNYKVKGYMNHPLYIYPILSYNNPIFNYKKNNIAFITYENYNKIEEKEEVYYNIKCKDYNNCNIKNILKFEKNIEKLPNYDNYLYTLKGDIKVLKNLSNFLFYFFLTFITIILFIILYKTFIKDKVQMGTLKLLGYRNIKVAISYLIYPFFISLCGCFIGNILGIIISKPLSIIYLKNYCLKINSLEKSSYFFKEFIIIFLFLSIITLLLIGIMLSKNELKLLDDSYKYKVNILTKITSKIMQNKDPLKKLKYLNMTKSISRLIVIFITTLTSGILITLSLSFYNIFNEVINKTFSKYKFSYIGIYDTIKNEKVLNADNILKVNIKPSKILTKDKKEKSIKDIEITLNAIDDKLLYIDITDDKNKDLTLKLTSNTIIINKNLKAKLNINNGDYIVFKINNKNRYFEVIGIEKTLINNEAYISNKALSNYMGFKKNIYNMVYLNNYDKNENYSFIYKLSLLKDNIINSMTFYSKALYFIIFIALLISYIVINIISLLVVDENKKFISMLKIFGYKNKKIEDIIINSYTIFIILTFLISIPISICIINKIGVYLSKYLNITYTFTYNFIKLLFGFIMFITFYYLSLLIAKQKVYKIDICEVLK